MLNSKYYPNQLDLSGARVLITGATSGIGRACAFRFIEMQCQLILVGRNESKLQSLGVELEQEIYQLSHHVGQGKIQLPQLIRLDVTEIEKIEELAAHIGPVDIIINNAGTNLGADTVDQVKTSNMMQMVLTNYSAPMAFVAAFSNMMKQRGTGHIVNVCSTAGDDVYANSSVYCSTKAALHAYTEAARHDLVDTPIRVTSISPGLVDTPLHEKKVGGDYNASRKAFQDIVPLYPEDIADQIVYACTRPRHVQVADVASYATNQSHSGVNGIKGVARVGPSLGANNQDRQGQGPQGQWRGLSPRQDNHYVAQGPRPEMANGMSPRDYGNSNGHSHSQRNNEPYYREDRTRDVSPVRSGMRDGNHGDPPGVYSLKFNNGSWSSNPLDNHGNSSQNGHHNYGHYNGPSGPGYSNGNANAPSRNILDLSN